MYFYSGDECQATQKKKELRNTHDTKTTLGYKSLLLGMQNTPKSISHQFFCCKIFKFISCTHVLRLAYENPKKKIFCIRISFYAANAAILSENSVCNSFWYYMYLFSGHKMKQMKLVVVHNNVRDANSRTSLNHTLADGIKQ